MLVSFTYNWNVSFYVYSDENLFKIDLCLRFYTQELAKVSQNTMMGIWKTRKFIIVWTVQYSWIYWFLRVNLTFFGLTGWMNWTKRDYAYVLDI